MEDFLGYHSEWNLGSPGGWEYQRITQELGKLAWQRLQAHMNLDIVLDFAHHYLNPVPNFARTLLRAHQLRKKGGPAHIVLVAEPETLESVVENRNFVQYLSTLPEVSAALAAPDELDYHRERPFHKGVEVTLIFMDFNNDVLLKMEKDQALTALRQAIKDGLVVNPRGMEPAGAKGLFEAVTDSLAVHLHDTTLDRTPWTRQFYERATTGPKGEAIPDLVAWTRKNWVRLVLKPVQGYSGEGIYIGFKSVNPDADLEHALRADNYIVQELVPLDLWAEDSPWLFPEEQRVGLRSWQTDFRCLITDEGLIGFLGRFGGIPTNVGAGGGTQALAFLPGSPPVGEVTAQINEAICRIPYRILEEIRQEVDERAVAMGHTYLLGPIMTAWRPRLVNETQVQALRVYCDNLWADAIKLADWWSEGKLDEFVHISPEEEAIARMAPWKGQPALMASDGLFSFGCHPDE
ncbi:MAG: hypothetical protein JSU72_00375 [Deltaproteobacteria bacterium]|nr:MAG: hypothetical protein JSU72_00375 [Deltaproteobacteria bacterium]